MELSIRLAQILKERTGAGRGAIKRICEATGLERHAVSALFHNEVKYVSLKNLGAICDYLVEYAGVDPVQLPGLLFGHEPSDFWELLAERQRLQICVGRRSDTGAAEDAWVTACDLHLQGQLVRGMLGARRTTGGHAPRPLEQTLVPAPSETDDADAESERRAEDHRREAEQVYRNFQSHAPRDCALICLGSAKSNPLVEILFANAFELPAFSTIDPPEPNERACPCYVRYRDGDVKPPSCFGGMDAPIVEGAAGVPPNSPGIYYKTAKGAWRCAVADDRRDAALLFYTYRPNEGHVEMVVGGFSGQATEWLAQKLPTMNIDAFAPAVENADFHAAMVVIAFSRDKRGATPSVETIPLGREVLGGLAV